jgi:hypothetical protein
MIAHQPPLVEALQAHNLTSHQAQIMLALHEARTWLPLEDLAKAAPGPTHNVEQAARLVQVNIRHIRKKFGSQAVLGLPDLQFTLGAPGVAVVRRAGAL